MLAHEHNLRRFLLDQRAKNARHRVGIERAGIIDPNRAIDAHCQGGADLFVHRGRADRHAHDLRRFAAFADAQRFLDRDLVERIDDRLGRGILLGPA